MSHDYSAKTESKLKHRKDHESHQQQLLALKFSIPTAAAGGMRGLFNENCRLQKSIDLSKIGGGDNSPNRIE